MLFAVVCAIAKDEDFGLREWVDYHLMIGFDKIFLFDNESRTPVRDILRDYVDAGVVAVSDIAGHGVQLSAYASFVAQFRETAEWAAFIDVDEFIVPKDCGRIADLLDRYDEFGGLGISWKVFGSCGYVSRPDRPVTEAYDRVLSRDTHIKTIVRLRDVAKVCSPHHFEFKGDRCCVNEHGVPVLGPESYHTSETVQVNHYYYKSQQDYECKSARGFATPLLHCEGYDMARFYRQAERKGELDTAIKRFASALRSFRRDGARLAACRLAEACSFDEPAVLAEAGRLLLESGTKAALAYLREKERYVNPVSFGLARVRILAASGAREETLRAVRLLLLRHKDNAVAFDAVLQELTQAYRRLGLSEQAEAVAHMLAV
ncbi:glycosyltransferase family 92 protein [Pseudodesulfovibrio sp.]|uniref:glycosyltransferase family 92 protein n=1 Tax=unclassified Pseudodesulfovibrio TaxID=2661612 RepID=UPI003B00B7DA